MSSNMSIRPILTAPDPRLKQVSKPVERVDDEIRALMDDMAETMYAAPGIGLAAIQIGVPKRVIVVDIDQDTKGRAPFFLANPQIVWRSEEVATFEEGCLSVPEEYEDVERPARARVRFLDENGELRERDLDGLLATCIQHEIDHLDGILFIDHLSRLKRGMILRRAEKALKQGAKPAQKSRARVLA
jgi:peptide deformylase